MFERERYDPQHHAVESFTCGNDELDAWLKTAATTAQRAGTASVHVWHRDGVVVAYYALNPWSVMREDAPTSMGGGGRGPAQVPAILIGKLALHSQLRGSGNGGVLLYDALGTAVEGARSIGGRLVQVDAIDENARNFYEHYGFKASPDQPFKLFMKTTKAAKVLGIPWS